MKERLKSGEFEDKAIFFSEITGLPITHLNAFPEIKNTRFTGSPSEVFTYTLVLGKQPESYQVDILINFSDEHTEGETYLPTKSWRILFNEKEIFRVGGMTNVSGEIQKDVLNNKPDFTKLLLEEFERATGGVDSETPFMDFERVSLSSLKDSDSYFENVYLVLMTHMKSRGLKMPPIISKSPKVMELVNSGKVEELQKLLASAVIVNQGIPRIKSHIGYESKVILEKAKWEKDKRDPNVPLTQTFSHLDLYKVEKGRKVFGPVNILLVENDLNNYGFFRDKVTLQLERDGRFKGANVITEVNLSACMQMAESGKIDLILFDWTKPSYEEILMFRGNTESLFDEYDHPDIRNKWMEKIAEVCNASGVKIPENAIIRSDTEIGNISQIAANALSIEG